MKNILFVMGGLSMGGVETYVVRLASELKKQGHTITVILLSNKYDDLLFDRLSAVAAIHVIEYFPFLGASSWLNTLVPSKAVCHTHFDVVHVVDLLTLSFMYFQRKKYSFTTLTIGIYHSREIAWWRDRDVYFRQKMLELYDRNIKLTLFPNESTAELAATFKSLPSNEVKLLPLGISLGSYRATYPKKSSLKLLSVGRLVDFKIYNRHVISILANLRKMGDFQYFIYGEGPEKKSLEDYSIECGVSQFVHFMGEVEYSALPEVLNEAFCFIGSGTTLIEASAAGVPSIVGIESISTPDTCGFFSEIEGYSYNEASATTRRVPIADCIELLFKCVESRYQVISDEHRNKASQFNIEETTGQFVSLATDHPDFDVRFSRCRAILSFLWSVCTLGSKALKSRFDNV
ncbi:glycosyltransferase family 4 protein [Pseudomonas frederiksbergensis]|uniref:glycosyltransferase family 4 protein n=1 Tax=Pseudomonas frederiksbergensis TaxID=104087 RepID=UPI000F48030C|nr:glycosyltransferase family 4 protein [Pseudomonas frederiksbergensis]